MRELEPYLADLVEAIASRDLGIELGLRIVRDARDASGLRVDFTYEESGSALEVTTIPDDDAAVMSEITKLSHRLSEKFSGWLLVVKSSAHIKALEPAILTALETGDDMRPGDYSWKDLERWTKKGNLHERLERHRRLEQLGIVDILRRPELDGVEVAAMGDVRTLSGIGEALSTALDQNAQKLAECRPRETHLAVGVVMFGAARNPALSNVPLLPPAVDHLWVIHLWAEPGDHHAIWYASQGAAQWQVHSSPA